MKLSWACQGTPRALVREGASCPLWRIVLLPVVILTYSICSAVSLASPEQALSTAIHHDHGAIQPDIANSQLLAMITTVQSNLQNKSDMHAASLEYIMKRTHAHLLQYSPQPGRVPSVASAARDIERDFQDCCTVDLQ